MFTCGPTGINSKKYLSISYPMPSSIRHPEKTITVRVKSDDENVVVAVQDQGVGIQPSKVAMLFQRFDTILQDNIYQQSTGIGLSLVKQLVDLHHARIDVQSEEGVGSTFEVSFPVGKRISKTTNGSSS